MTLKELIDYGLTRDTPLDYPNSPPIETLEEFDNTLRASIANVAINAFNKISRIVGLRYGGILSIQTSIRGDSFYYDDASEMFYYRKNMNKDDILEGSFKIDYNWIPLVIKMENNKMFVYTGFPDISTGLLSVHNRITNNEIRMSRLNGKVSSLEKDKIKVGEVVQGYFPLDQSYPNFIDLDSGMLSKTEYSKLYEVMKNRDVFIQETDTHFRIVRIGGLVIKATDENRTLFSLENESQKSHSHKCTSVEDGIHSHDDLNLGGNGQNEGGGIPSDSDGVAVYRTYNTPPVQGHTHTYITNEVGGQHFVCKNIALRVMIRYK